MPVPRTLIGFSLLVIACIGCGQEPTGIAVVDLDEVAKRLGRDQSIVNSVKETQDELNQQLNNILAQLRQEYQKQKEKFGEEPTDEQKAQLKAMESRMASLLNQKGRQATSIYRNEQLKQLVRFREEVKPVTKEIALEKGFAIVIPKDQNMLLSADPAVDITELVIAKMRANPAPAPAPTVKPTTPEDVPASETAKATTTKRSSGTSKSRVSEKDERNSRRG